VEEALSRHNCAWPAECQCLCKSIYLELQSQLLPPFALVSSPPRLASALPSPCLRLAPALPPPCPRLASASTLTLPLPLHHRQPPPRLCPPSALVRPAAITTSVSVSISRCLCLDIADLLLVFDDRFPSSVQVSICEYFTLFLFGCR
jgi:hypothetical protein